MSRRVQKRVFAWNATLNGGAGDWEANPEVYQRFVYDQWNVVLVLDGPNRTITHKYTWGLDLSGLAGQGAATAGEQSRDREGAVPGIHGAGGIGGIGGLLAVEAPQAEGDPLRHWYFYDGNGNVGQLLAYDATGPTVSTSPAAKYEYDPYGQFITHTDTIANPFRFSTKWHDAEVSLVYYGRRFYRPDLGRWLNRDPIEEQGGLHLYVFVKNASPYQVDPRGLDLLDFVKELFGCAYLNLKCRMTTSNTTECEERLKQCRRYQGRHRHHHCFDGVTGRRRILLWWREERFCLCNQKLDPIISKLAKGCGTNHCDPPVFCTQ